MNLNIFNHNKDLFTSLNSSYIKSFVNELNAYLKNPKFNSMYKNDTFMLDRIEGNWAIIRKYAYT